METLIKNIENYRLLTDSISEQSFGNRYSFSLDCSDFPELDKGVNCCSEPALDYFFKAIKKIKAPTLYWFTVHSHHDSRQVYDSVLNAKTMIKRQFPALMEFTGASKVLYVGKVDRDLASRMITHFGYDVNSENQGLQLYYWAKKMGIQLKFNCIVLKEELKDLLCLFEAHLSQELQPIIGKF